MTAADGLPHGYMYEIYWFVLSIDRSHPVTVEPKRRHRALAWPSSHDASIPLRVRVRRPYSSTWVTDVFALVLAASIAAQSFSFHLRDVFGPPVSPSTCTHRLDTIETASRVATVWNRLDMLPSVVGAVLCPRAGILQRNDG